METVLNLEQIDADLAELRSVTFVHADPWALKALRTAEALRAEVDALYNALGQALTVPSYGAEEF